MKLFFSFFSIALTLTPSFSASVPEPSSPMTTAEKQAPTTLTLSELIQEGKEMQASIIEGSLLSLILRFDGLTERGNHYATFTRHLAVHAAKCEDPNAFPGYGIILEDMRANPNTQAAAEALLDMEELIHLATSGSLSPNVLQHILAKLDERKARDLAARKEVIAQNQQKFILATFINDRLLSQLNGAFVKEMEKLRKFRDVATINKWKLESPISTGMEGSATAEFPDIATLIRDIKEYTADVAKQEVAYLENTRLRLLANIQKINTLLEKALAAKKQAINFAGVEEHFVLEGVIKALREDRDATNESLEKENHRLDRLNS